MNHHPGTQEFAEKIGSVLNQTNAAKLDFLQLQLLIASKHLSTVPFTDEHRKMLAERGLNLRQIDQEAFEKNCFLMKPATVLRWDRAIRRKEKETKQEKTGEPGRPLVTGETIKLDLALARANASWGYQSIANALILLGILISKTSVGNILRKHGLPTAPDRIRTGRWTEKLHMQADVTWNGDFFHWKCGMPFMKITFFVLFFVHVKTRRLVIAGMTKKPDSQWVRDATIKHLSPGGAMAGAQFLVLDGDPLFKDKFAAMLQDGSLGRKVEVLRARHPDMNAFAERAVRTIKEYLRGLIMGEQGLRYALREIETFYNNERPHQGLRGAIPVPDERSANKTGNITHLSGLGDDFDSTSVKHPEEPSGAIILASRDVAPCNLEQNSTSKSISSFD